MRELGPAVILGAEAEPTTRDCIFEVLVDTFRRLRQKADEMGGASAFFWIFSVQQARRACVGRVGSSDGTCVWWRRRLSSCFPLARLRKPLGQTSHRIMANARFPRCTLSFLFLGPSNTSDRGDAMRKSNGCTSADGMAAKRRTER